MANRRVIHGDAQLFGHHLREDSLMSLAVGAGTGEHRDLSGALHAHRRAFKSGPAARLHKRRDAHTNQFSGAAHNPSVAAEDVFGKSSNMLNVRLAKEWSAM